MVKKFFIGLGLVLTIGVPVGSYYLQKSLKDYHSKTKMVLVKFELNQLYTLLKLYKFDHGVYPRKLDELKTYKPWDQIKVEYKVDGETFIVVATNKEGKEMQINEKKELRELAEKSAR